MKLTEAQRRELQHLSQNRTRPLERTGPNKAMANKLVKLGLAEYRFGYPTGFVITDAGRAALEASNG